ncbi:MAG: glycosyltransferase family 2 protein [Elusimicrobia bacterium]|nr:glycosyltransferase family 2 protein [Elusimicrobiota bacterium]
MIYIVVLAYNEASGIAALLTELASELGRQPGAYRFLVVDDGSTDGTLDAVRLVEGGLPVTVLRHYENQGVGAAFNTGLRHAAEVAQDGDVIVTIEGDRTNRANIIPEMLRELDRNIDVVCASRYIPGGAYVGFPLTRRILSWGANWVMRVFYRVPGVKDYTIFYRAYRARVLKKAIAAYQERFIESRGFTANAEILFKAASIQSLHCSEVAMVYRYDLKKGRSKMRILKNLYEYGVLFLKFLGARTQERPRTRGE